MLLSLFLFCFLNTVFGKIYYYDSVSKDSLSKWVKSSNKDKEIGFLTIVPSQNTSDPTDLVIKTADDEKHYFYTSKFDEVFSVEGKTLVFQYTAQYEQNIDCGGGYLKLLYEDYDEKDFTGDTPYFIMFGPDICGYNTRKVHLILNYKGKNYPATEDIPIDGHDKRCHLYTLIISPDGTFEVKIDNIVKLSGNIKEKFDIFPPKFIKDVNDVKPDDWDDNETIVDESDTKPDDWVEEEFIDDPNPVKIEDWNEEDGEQVPNKIPNPDYKGEWKPKRIPNPNYKGPWVQKEVPNPEYSEDINVLSVTTGGLGMDLWQVKSGTNFDEFLVTDDLDEAQRLGDAALQRIALNNVNLDQEDERLRKEHEEMDKKSKSEDEAGKDDGEDNDDDDDDDDDDDENDDKDDNEKVEKPEESKSAEVDAESEKSDEL